MAAIADPSHDDDRDASPASLPAGAAEAASAFSRAEPCSLQDLPARLSAAMSARGAHPARTVVLLPFGQLMAPARRAWATYAPDGFAPRFETTLSWAARHAFAPGPDDLSFDRAVDLLTARSLLERAGLAEDAGVLAPRLVEAAWQMAPLAAAVLPAGRGAWAQSAVAGSGLGLEHPMMALEAALARIAVEWAAASAHVTDRVLAQEAGALDLLVVLEGLQPDPVARALARHLGLGPGPEGGQAESDRQNGLGRPAGLGRAEVWPVEVPQPMGRIALHACPDPADEAERAAACVMHHLDQGRAPVALAAVDRVLTRRIRAMLGARGVRIADETGWKLSTTRAAAQFMGLLRAARWDAPSDEVLDWLKHLPAASTPALRALERRLRREGLRSWLEVGEGAQDANAENAVNASNAAKDAPVTGSAEGDLVRQANAWRERLRQPRPLPRWQQALRELLQETGAWPALEADPAGAQLISVLGLDEAGQHLWACLPQAGRRMGLDELAAWAGEALEAASFLPAPPEQPQVVVLPFNQLLARRFEALVVPGCDEVRLAPSPEPPGPWTAGQRRALGLPSREDLEQALRTAWRAALALPEVDLLWRGCDDKGDPVLPSPLVQQLRLSGLGREGTDPRVALAVAPSPVLPPQPRAPQLVVRELSASAYGDLRRCPYRFFALRQLGLQEAAEIDVELGKRDFGNWLHEVLHQFHEALAQAGQADRAQRAALMDRAAEGAKRKLGLQDGEFLPFEAGWPQLREGYLAALEKFEASQGARYEAGEQSRDAGLGPVRLVGRIDRIDRVGTADASGVIGRMVMDYKTESADVTRKRVKNPMEDTQMAFYAALIGEEGLQGCYVNVGERGETLFIAQPGLEEAREALVAGILGDMERIAAGAPLQALGAGTACDHCAARGLCRKDFWTADDATAIAAPSGSITAPSGPSSASAGQSAASAQLSPASGASEDLQ